MDRTGGFYPPNVGSIPTEGTTTEIPGLRQGFCVVPGAAMIRQQTNPRAGVAEIASDDEQLSVTTKYWYDATLA